MRKLTLIPVVLIAVMFTTSCAKTELTQLTAVEAQNIIPGSYKVNDFANDNGNFTQYDNYTFEFRSNGTVVATNGVETYSGTWDIKAVNTDPVYDKEVSISISGNMEMDDLNHVWFVKSVTDVTLGLIDDDSASEILFIKI